MIPLFHARNREKAPSVISVVSCSIGNVKPTLLDYRNLLHSVICVLSWVLPPITERDAWNASDSVRRPFTVAQGNRNRREQRKQRSALYSLLSLLPPVGLFFEHGESGFPISDFAQTGQRGHCAVDQRLRQIGRSEGKIAIPEGD